jgi:hypothetical protein
VSLKNIDQGVRVLFEISNPHLIFMQTCSKNRYQWTIFRGTALEKRVTRAISIDTGPIFNPKPSKN